MCVYFCAGFFGFMLKAKNLLDFANLFSPNDYEKNDKIILKYFQQNLNKLKCIVMFVMSVINIENLKNVKIIYIIILRLLLLYYKALRLSIAYSICGDEYIYIYIIYIYICIYIYDKEEYIT